MHRKSPQTRRIKRRWTSALLTSALLTSAISLLVAVDQVPGRQDSLQDDFSAELPRIEPRDPADALTSFKVATGFDIELVASEPQVQDPVAMTFDSQGRMYVVEMLDYSEHPDESLGRIRLLEDSDGDGMYETSTIFAEQLSWPTAIIASQGGVYVAAAPDLYFLIDNDGDRIADVRRTVFTGFGRSNVQGLVNSLRWGIDNRIHGATSSSGGTIAHVEHPDIPALTLRGRDFAFDPRTEIMQAVSGGGQHGMSFSRFGEKFVCANSNHIQFIVYEDRYLAQNPFVSGAATRLDIAADGPQADVFRASPVEPWRTVRTRLRRQGLVPGPLERGGRASGYFTGATGVTIYDGNQWPQTDHETAIIGDVGSNLVHRKQLEAVGVRYQATRIDQQSELLTSEDNWFRPVQFANGPDGTLYVLDMYREVIEHPKSLPPAIKRHLNLDSGRNRGRIYRLYSTTRQRLHPQAFSDASPEELLAGIRSQNGWTRETAARLIYERQDRRVIAGLISHLDSPDPETVIWSLASLFGLEALSREHIFQAVNHTHPHVRIWGIRWAETRLKDDPGLFDSVLLATNDIAVKVRLQAAFSLGTASGTRRNQALARVLAEAGGDPWLETAAFCSLSTGAGEAFLELAATDVGPQGKDDLEHVLLELAGQIMRSERPVEQASLLEWFRENGSQDKVLADKILEVVLREHADFAMRIEAETGIDALANLRQRALRAAERLTLPELSIEEKLKSIRLLRWGDRGDVSSQLSALIHAGESGEVQQMAITTWHQVDAEQLLEHLSSCWPQLTPETQRHAVDQYLSRTGSARRMLESMAAGRITNARIDTLRLQLLSKHQDPDIADRAAELLQARQLGNRNEVVQQYLANMPGQGSQDLGRAVFEKQCSNCHQVAGMGTSIGPSLSAMIARGSEAVVTNILDPNREVNPQFLSYQVVTTDGRSLSGVIIEENANSILLQNSNGEVERLLRIDIEEINNSGLSLMPEGLEREISYRQMADLLEFLSTSE